ncbi:Oidioi.mRNA.OKI2018_I69.chr2.g6016.t1.cds [Oikopleura dioica]|uniref:Oidioi.mRNA.OKI2018_I69.chr2.g6016.t1.cds n=1 Tax=Oikopleura dioica TaxID=34765 RepID=A0ABN7T2M8_OIKDI|nr:Oidioi.mRNA.OKI2018_I69.chr2.g6016.t1.cds [Oikopleura dioica]
MSGKVPRNELSSLLDYFTDAKTTKFGHGASYDQLDKITELQLSIHKQHYEIDSDNPKKDKLCCSTDELEKVNEIFNKMKNISDKISSLRFKTYDSLEEKFRKDLHVRSRSKINKLYVFALAAPACFIWDASNIYRSLNDQFHEKLEYILEDAKTKTESQYKKLLVMYWHTSFENGISPTNNHPFDIYTFYPLTTPCAALVYAGLRDISLRLALEIAILSHAAKRGDSIPLGSFWKSRFMSSIACNTVKRNLNMSWSPPNEHSGKYFYHNIVIANLKKLRANYPRYSIRFFSLLALCGTFVASTCYQFIQIAKKQQLEYLNTVFKEDAFKDFKFEELDSYAMQNIIINILDNNPEIFHNKKQVLSYYVGLLTQNNTDPLYSRSWLPFSPLISLQYLFNDLELRVGPCPKVSTLLGDFLFYQGIKYPSFSPLYPYLNNDDAVLRSVLLRQKYSISE